MIAEIINCWPRQPNSWGCKTTLRQRLSQSTKGRWRGGVSSTRAEYLNDMRTSSTRAEYLNDMRTSLIMTLKSSPSVLPFQPGMKGLPPSTGVPSRVSARKTPKVVLRESLNAVLNRGARIYIQSQEQRWQNQPSSRPIFHKLQSWSRSPQNSSSPHWIQHSCFSQHCPYRCLVHPAGPSVTQEHWPLWPICLLLPPTTVTFDEVKVIKTQIKI